MIIEYFNEIYPETLKMIEKPPSRLYAIGNIEILKNYGIAVVGSRCNTKYGEKVCKQFTQSLVEYNFSIISGLAVGIDSIAHKTCLENSGKTIAVLPCGLENIYPKENINLAKEILKNEGLLITEYEEHVKADSEKFRERNRIVAGLGIGTLIIEAGNRSGTSITARHTILQDKPLFAIPSNLDNIKGKTTNKLIQNGGHLVTCVEDILRFYPNVKFSKKEIDKKDIYIDIPENLKNVYKVINNEPQDINQIARKAKISVSEVSYKTMMLQIDEKIIELPGQRFIRKD